MSDRKTHWEKVYHQRRSEDLSWYQERPDISLRMIRDTGFGRTEPLIDVGGGASNLVDHLLAEGYERVSVLDIAAGALELARERLKEAAGRVCWYESDVTRFEPPCRFSLWHDRAVFHFLTDARDRACYVNTLKQALNPGGQLILAAFAPDGPEQCSGLPVMRYDEARLMAVLGDGFRLLEQATEQHMTPGSVQQPFGYFRLLFRDGG